MPNNRRIRQQEIYETIGIHLLTQSTGTGSRGLGQALVGKLPYNVNKTLICLITEGNDFLQFLLQKN